MKKQSADIDQFGIASQYRDASGQFQKAPRQTVAAIRDQMGQTASSEKFQCRVLKVGQGLPLGEPVQLTLEDGTSFSDLKTLPRDLPTGYHEMVSERSGMRTLLLVTPGGCYLPKAVKVWGWAVQLYTLRSQKSWGIGDLKDLQSFAQWTSKSLGTDFILANPLAANTPILPQQSSPYYPTSRLFLNLLYLRIEDIPMPDKVRVQINNIAKQGRSLNEERLINRDEIFRLKMKALKIVWRQISPNSKLEKFCLTQGRPLKEFATFCALAEYFKGGWREWPTPFQQVQSSAVLQFAEDHEDEVRFYQWLQWLLDQQLRRAVKSLPVMQDLPIGFDPNGADAWRWQEMLAQDMAIGAPPDAYNSDGQNWGMQPFVPQKLRESGYQPLRQTFSAALRFGGGLRIDHVMGLFRLFWIPAKNLAKEGTYVYYPANELLAVLEIESQRAKALIVGEDLGTVEPSVRTELRRRNVLSYRLLWFESSAPAKFPEQALSAVTTHDLFTVAGLWNGTDIIRQKKLGLHPNEKGMEELQKKLSQKIQLPLQSSPSEAVTNTYQYLAQAPSRLITATLEDALAVEERPNLPGASSEVPNWSLALPIPLEKIKKSSLIKAVAKACKR